MPPCKHFSFLTCGSVRALTMRRRHKIPNEWIAENPNQDLSETPITPEKPDQPGDSISLGNVASTVLLTSRDYLWILFELFSAPLKRMCELIASYVPLDEANVDETTRNKLEQFKQHVSIPYDHENQEHESRLHELWKLSFPKELLENRISKKWAKLGFQGTDPKTDFRGCGTFGLDNLLYFAKNYPNRYNKLLLQEGRLKDFSLDTSVQRIESYPLSISGLNITMLLFEKLGWGMKSHLEASNPARNKLLHLLFDENHQNEAGPLGCTAFHEIYVFTFNLFDQQWELKKARKLDFGTVLQSTREKLDVLIQQFTSLEDIVQINKVTEHM